MPFNLFWVYVVVGVVDLAYLFFIAKKVPATKDYPNSMQWGALILLISVFGALSEFMSFTTVMFVLVVISGAVVVIDHWVLAPRRSRLCQNVTASALCPAKQESIVLPDEGRQGTPHSETDKQRDVAPGFWIENARGFFPVLLLVFVLRAFLAEPFTIPSSSMRPGLIVGDFILVNKFIYGIRVPILNEVFIPVSAVQRGDVVVFNFPPDPKINYIKRVIGLPGDRVEYKNKQLTVNGKLFSDVPDGYYDYLEKGVATIRNNRFIETQNGHQYGVLTIPYAPSLSLSQVESFPHRDRCQYDENGFICSVPEGHYFMMGDNRDNSLDSRYWGFVDDRLLVGKAFMIWMNFSDLSRIGKAIQ